MADDQNIVESIIRARATENTRRSTIGFALVTSLLVGWLSYPLVGLAWFFIITTIAKSDFLRTLTASAGSIGVLYLFSIHFPSEWQWALVTSFVTYKIIKWNLSLE